jgi:hypothetical protein
VTDYSEHGAEPIDDAAVEEPPTVDEVLERQRVEYPDQARTATTGGAGGADPDGDQSPGATGGEAGGRDS